MICLIHGKYLRTLSVFNKISLNITKLERIIKQKERGIAMVYDWAITLTWNQQLNNTHSSQAPKKNLQKNTHNKP